MSITTHQRPGVYSKYDASSLIYGSGQGTLVGLAAVNTAVAPNQGRLVTSFERAAAIYGADSAMARLAGCALRNGAGGVVCVATADSSGYGEAFEVLAGWENISVMICDSTGLTVQQAMRDWVLEASTSRRERIAVAACAQGESVEQLVGRAAGLNSERVVLIAPGGVDSQGSGGDALEIGACVAGALIRERDPAIPLGGTQLMGVSGVEKTYRDSELDQLILGGVTPVEQVGGVVSVVRGVTTRTTTGGSPDHTWRDLCTIRVVDTVIPGLRASLRSKFRRVKNTPRGRGAIRAQVVLELENFLAREIITAYDSVSVTADEQDPTRALVDFSFTVAHGLNQIWLSAHITV